MELLNVGGNANNGAQCGLSYANSNNGFSNSNTNIGARLNIYIEQKKELSDMFPLFVLTDFAKAKEDEHTIEPVSMEG